MKPITAEIWTDGAMVTVVFIDPNTSCITAAALLFGIPIHIEQGHGPEALIELHNILVATGWELVDRVEI